MADSTVIENVDPADMRLARDDPDAKAVFDFLCRYRNPKTRQAYASDLKTYLRFCRERDIGMLTATRGDLERFITHLQSRDLAPATVAGMWSTIFNFLEFAEIDERIPRNVARQVQRPKIDRDAQRRPYFEIGEVHAIISCARRRAADAGVELAYTIRPDSQCGKHRRDEAERRYRRARSDYTLLQLMASTGMRVGSVCSLDVESLHMDSGTAYFEYIRKGGRLTRETVSLETLLILREHIGPRTTGPMFLNMYDRRITRHNVACIIDRLAKQVGIDRHVPPHGLRRSFATIARQLGTSQSELQAAMHHADPRTTSLYDMRKDSGGAAARLKVAELLSA